MTYRTSVKNGRIILDIATSLPDGATVNVEVQEEVAAEPSSPAKAIPRRRSFTPIEMPGNSLAEELVRERR